MAVCPCDWRDSATRQTLVVTPVRLGRKDSVAMATLTAPTMTVAEVARVTSGWVPGEHQMPSWSRLGPAGLRVAFDP